MKKIDEAVAATVAEIADRTGHVVIYVAPHVSRRQQPPQAMQRTAGDPMTDPAAEKRRES